MSGINDKTATKEVLLKESNSNLGSNPDTAKQGNGKKPKPRKFYNGNPNRNNSAPKQWNFKPKENKPGKTYFADPDPNAKPLYTDGFELHDGPKVIGDFLISFDFPYNCTRPYLDTLVAELRARRVKNTTIRLCVNQLLFVSYLTATANVLNSVNARIYGIFKGYKAFTEVKNLKLPNFLNAYLSIIGNIESKLGRLELEFAEVYLEGWALLAHEYYHLGENLREDQIRPNNLLQKLDFPVFNTDKGIEFIKQKICAFYNDDCDEFAADVNGTHMFVRTPLLTVENFNAYVVQDVYAYKSNNNSDYYRNLIQQVVDWETNHHQSVLRFDGNVFRLKDNFDIRNIIDLVAADAAELDYISYIPEDYFQCSDRIVTRVGTAAQLISRDPRSEYDITCDFPIADSDAYVGYLTNPCVSLKYKTSYFGHFHDPQNILLSALANKDRVRKDAFHQVSSN